MGGELRTSQFRWTTTANDDFVIGNPEDASAHNTKFLVFQTNTTPGFATNPHLRCEYVSTAWHLKIYDGVNTLDLSDAAYKSINNTFTGINIFNTGNFTVNSDASFTGSFSGTGNFNITNFTNATILSPSIVLGSTGTDNFLVNSSSTFNSAVNMQSDLIVGGNLTINGTSSSLNTTILTVKDKLVTINSGGAVTSANGAGIEVQENSVITGYIKIGNNRNSWEILTPNKLGTIQLTPGVTSFNTEIVSSATTNRVITLPNLTGTLALLSDINLVYTAGRALQTNSSTGLAEVSGITNTKLNYLAGVTSDIQSQFASYVTLNTDQTITFKKHIYQADLYMDYNSGLSGGSGLDGKINFRRSTTSGAPYYRVIENRGDLLSIGTTTATSGGGAGNNLTFAVNLGDSNISPAYQAGLVLTRNYSNNKTVLELATSGSGSSIILADTVTGTRYELYVTSGVLTIATAP